MIPFAGGKSMSFFVITGSLTQTIRNFAKGLESSLRVAISSIPEGMVNVKVSSHHAVQRCLAVNPVHLPLTHCW